MVGVRGHHRRGRTMEKAQSGVGQARRQAGSRPDIFWEARVVARRERPSGLQAMAAREPADRPFGGDMDMVRRKIFDALTDLGGPREGEADIGIGRHRRRPHSLRGEKVEARAERGRGPGHLLQRRDDAIDLRPPGVGRDQDAHHAASACASSGFSSTGASTSTGAGIFRVRGQRSTSIRPSQCSTTSEQDSTKSPVFT